MAMTTRNSTAATASPTGYPAPILVTGLPADFRFPMMDLRLSLARLCAVDGRLEEADHWFGQARSVLEEQGARSLRAIVDFDQALMNARAERMARARRPLDAAISQFQQIGMIGWLSPATLSGHGWGVRRQPGRA